MARLSPEHAVIYTNIKMLSNVFGWNWLYYFTTHLAKQMIKQHILTRFDQVSGKISILSNDNFVCYNVNPHVFSKKCQGNTICLLENWDVPVFSSKWNCAGCDSQSVKQKLSDWHTEIDTSHTLPMSMQSQKLLSYLMLTV